jgi:hypothetical protein
MYPWSALRSEAIGLFPKEDQLTLGERRDDQGSRLPDNIVNMIKSGGRAEMLPL